MKHSKKQENLADKVMSWFWVVLFISAILFLRTLLVEMHIETTRLTEESERWQRDLEEEREESRELYEEFYAELNKTIERAIETLKRGEVSQQPFNNSSSGFGW